MADVSTTSGLQHGEVHCFFGSRYRGLSDTSDDVIIVVEPDVVQKFVHAGKTHLGWDIWTVLEDTNEQLGRH